MSPPIKKIGILGILFILVGSLSCEKQQGEDFRSKTNSSPVITSVKILPEKPNIESELNVLVQSQNPDQNPVTYHYQWIKDDDEITGEDRNVLKGDNFRKGDFIRVKVTPSDGKVEGKPFLSDPVKILNSLPVIQEIRIEPKMAYSNDPLKVNIKSDDVDGDSIYYTYRWEKNGVVLTEERTEVLEKGQFKKGDVITVTVTPDDRENQGPSKRSESITILNSPPVIVSSPPTSIDGNDYNYQVKAYDPDNDPIFFALKSAPKGMEIDKETGLIRWIIQWKDKGTHSIEIEASDKEGGKSSQRFVLNMEIR